MLTGRTDTLPNDIREQKRKMIVIAGPTAAGKTKLSVELAKAVGGEILSADSMQVYRGMDIGSAKVLPEEMGGIRHHLIDILDPTEEFHVAKFRQLAQEAMDREIYPTGHIPVMTGGTGFYIQSVLYGIDFEDDICPADAEVRKRLEEEGETPEGQEAQWKRLLSVDPKSCEKIHPNNRKRVIRALEYFETTGRPISEHNESEKTRISPYDYVFFVLNVPDRARLYARIDERVEKMMAEGLLEEVRRLREAGVTKTMTSMQGIGYKELYRALDGECTVSEAVEEIKKNTRHFAKRQLTWFRNFRDPSLIWLDAEDPELLTKALDCLKQRKLIQ